MFIIPGGRLTLSPDAPVLIDDVVDAETVHYVPHRHNNISLWDGSDWIFHTFEAMAQSLADGPAEGWSGAISGKPISVLEDDGDIDPPAPKSPERGEGNSLYDMFVWNDCGTLRCTRGPRWHTDGAWPDGTLRYERGEGSGTTELERFGGVPVNAVDITNGPLARRGHYVGTIATNPDARVDMMFFPAPECGGTDNRLYVWNMYNRVLTPARNIDNGPEYEYSDNTIRRKRNSAANRVSLVIGIAEDAIDCAFGARADTLSSTSSRVGLGLNDAENFHPLSMTPEYANHDGMPNDSQDLTAMGVFRGRVGAGLFRLNLLERAGNPEKTVLWRDNISPWHFQGMNLSAWM